VQGRISGALRKLSVSPQFAPAVIKLKGEPKGYRLRVGQYRVLYRIAERGRLVAVIRIGHRREVYR
jgi:mRNA interferase RelE/StbE